MGITLYIYVMRYNCLLYEFNVKFLKFKAQFNIGTNFDDYIYSDDDVSI